MISQHFLKNLQFDCELFFAASSGVHTFHDTHHFSKRCCFAVVLHSNKLLWDPLPLQCWGLLFFPLAPNSLSHFDFRQKASGITGSRNKTPKKYLPQNYWQKLMWKAVNQDDVCHPRKQSLRYFNHRYSLNRCAKTSISGNTVFTYYTPFLSFASVSFSYSQRETFQLQKQDNCVKVKYEKSLWEITSKLTRKTERQWQSV